MSAPLIALEGAGMAYGRQVALRGLDLALHGGECVAMVGHNGAGKSTAIKLMLGLIRPTGGRVRVAIERERIGYLPENVAFSPAMTGAETLAFYARLKRQDLRANAALLARVGLAEAAGRRVGGYSKGMRQRLGLAQALVGQPQLLLLDEPTTGLDPAVRLEFYGLLRALRDAGVGVLLSSHALAEIEGQADRVVVMQRGRKLADGSIAELRARAGVRPRLRIRLPRAPRAVVNGADPWAGWSRLPGDVLETECDEGRLPAALRALPADAADIEIVRPTLDEVYARLLQEVQ
jgi:Cu-processing system ATP-binding protein